MYSTHTIVRIRFSSIFFFFFCFLLYDGFSKLCMTSILQMHFAVVYFPHTRWAEIIIVVVTSPPHARFVVANGHRKQGLQTVAIRL